jgi:hypothetical protein
MIYKKHTFTKEKDAILARTPKQKCVKNQYLIKDCNAFGTVFGIQKVEAIIYISTSYWKVTCTLIFNIL